MDKNSVTAIFALEYFDTIDINTETDSFFKILSKTAFNILLSNVSKANSKALSHFLSFIYCGILINMDFSLSKNFRPISYFSYLKAFFAILIYEIFCTPLNFEINSLYNFSCWGMVQLVGSLFIFEIA